MVVVDEVDLEAYMDEVFGKYSPESKFCSPPPSPPSPPSAPPPDSKKDKKNKKDKKPKKDKNDKKIQKDMKTVKRSKKDPKNKKDKKCKNDKKDEKAKKTEKGDMTVIIEPSSTCQKEESSITLHVVGSDTIGEVNRKIKDRRRLEGRPPAINMALIFGNKGLADAKTLKFYKIPDKAHLRLEVE
jgi:hypothetical protein